MSAAVIQEGKVILPYQWTVRKHQQPFMRNMWNGKKRAVLVWHRRAGKDNGALNFTAVETQRKVANYWHMFPEQKQGRKALWEGVNPHTGIKFIDQAFPKEIRASQNETDMLIRFKNGSTWQIVGSDTFDSNVGTTPYGIVFSEWSLCDPRAWDFLRPILRENGGWAIFVYTPRGKNHGHDLYEMAKNNPDWHCELLTIEDTVREDGTRIFTDADYQEELNEGMDPLLARQEYYCSFDAGLFGAYYTDQLKKAKFGDYPWNPRKPVHTFWDLGLRDATSIWFGQDAGDGSGINVIDYWEESNVSLIEWCGRINSAGYNYGSHTAPHDIKRRDYKDATSYIETAAQYGVHFEVMPSLSLREGIDATKSFIPRLRFNTSTTQRGIDCLYNYRREYNEKLKIFMDRPLHDWASHGADSMRNMAICWPENFSGMSREFRVKMTNGETRTVGTRHGRYR